MRIFLIFLITIFTLNAAQKIKITSVSFEANERDKISVFKGDVHLSKGEDKLKADEIKVFFDDKNRPVKYEANGNVEFFANGINKSSYEGEAQKVIYKPSEDSYYLYGSVNLFDKTANRKLSGGEIILNISKGEAKVMGMKKKPVVMTFSIDDDKVK